MVGRIKTSALILNPKRHTTNINDSIKYDLTAFAIVLDSVGRNVEQDLQEPEPVLLFSLRSFLSPP